MKNLFRILLCLMLIVSLISPTVLAYEGAAFDKAYSETIDYLKALGTPSVGSVGGEWLVIALTRAGEECPDGYYENVISYIEKKINDKEQLHKSKSTDNSRVILGLTSAGYDPRDVGGHDLIYGLTDMTYLRKQGPNGPIWALIALDCNNYEIPVNPDAVEQTTREALITQVLSNQLTDGGWAMSGKSADPDMTAMAIQSLAPYYDSVTEVKTAVDKALDILSVKQHDNGGFGSVDGACSESSAQVIVALTSLGIDPVTDARFVKNSNTMIDAILEFAVDGGGFAHIPGGALNGMATEQSQYALVAYKRFTEGKNSLYNMTEESIEEDVEDVPIVDEEDSLVQDDSTEDEMTEDKVTSTVVDNNADNSVQNNTSEDKDDINAITPEDIKESGVTQDNKDTVGNETNKIKDTSKPQTNTATGESAAQTGDIGIAVCVAVFLISLVLILRRRGCRA